MQAPILGQTWSIVSARAAMAPTCAGRTGTVGRRGRFLPENSQAPSPRFGRSAKSQELPHTFQPCPVCFLLHLRLWWQICIEDHRFGSVQPPVQKITRTVVAEARHPNTVPGERQQAFSHSGSYVGLSAPSARP